jgi:lipopolysaccharide/colanic/teichoic acid biosynthesis glycosyltransferase
VETERADSRIRTVPDLSILPSIVERIQREQSAPHPISAIEMTTELPQSSWLALLEAARYQGPLRLMYCLVLKRWIDLLIASVLIVILAPVMLLIALAIWLDIRGPVIYRQRRIGRYGVPFTVYKFRTMIPDRRKAMQPYPGPERRKVHKSATDPRVTRIGKIMRRTSLDELPQLFNVLRGEMSLVGPRPELPEIVIRYEPWQHIRHLVLPGITGWWQTRGTCGLMHEHTDLDIYYVQHVSLAMDIRILLGTVRALVSRAGAF